MSEPFKDIKTPLEVNSEEIRFVDPDVFKVIFAKYENVWPGEEEKITFNTLLGVMETKKPWVFQQISAFKKDYTPPYERTIPEGFRKIGQWLMAEKDRPTEELDNLWKELSEPLSFGLLGLVKLYYADNVTLRKDRYSKLSKRIGQIYNSDQNRLAKSWRLTRLSPLDKLLILLGNDNLTCLPEEARALIDDMRTYERISFANSIILGPVFYFRRPGLGLDVVSSRLGSLKFCFNTPFNFESRVVNLLSYGRDESLLKMQQSSPDLLDKLTGSFYDYILFGKQSSPYGQQREDIKRIIRI